MSPVTNEHAAVVGFLVTLLSIFVDARGLGVVRSEPFQMKTGTHLPGRSPDVLFLARRHLRRLKRTHIEGPADVVIEIISRESRARDRGEKFYEYETGGVPEYWLIDPERRQAEFYRRGRNGIYQPVVVGRDTVFRSAVLAGFWLKVHWLWSRPPLLSVLKEWKLVR